MLAQLPSPATLMPQSLELMFSLEDENAYDMIIDHKIDELHSMAELDKYTVNY